MDGIEAQTEEEILGYLRHEAGHAFNYAHKLYETEECQRVFGDYSAPYRDDYVPQPFSRNYVRHIPGWYAQKHPGRGLFRDVCGLARPATRTGASCIATGAAPRSCSTSTASCASTGRKPPLVTRRGLRLCERGARATRSTSTTRRRGRALLELPAEFDHDLREMFRTRPAERRRPSGERADQFIARHRRDLVDRICRLDRSVRRDRALADQPLHRALREARAVARCGGSEQTLID